jgi:dipeptidyl aminopeptidase/acylaminoacyl peptidase
MSDLASKFRSLDGLSLPLRLERFEAIAPGVPAPEPPRRSSRLAVVVVALALTALAIAFVAVVFARTPRPVIAPPTSHPAPSLSTPPRTGTPSPTPSTQGIVTGNVPPRGSLVFDQERSRSRSDIVFVARGGTTAIPMTDAWRSGLVAHGAAWSPEGKRVAFIVGASDSWQYTGQGDLYVMNANGSGLRLLPVGAANQPTWSSDGMRIAFVRDQGSELCVINADGSGLRVIDSHRGYYQLPKWSPTGDEIAFQSNVVPGSGTDRTAIFLIRPDGSHEVRVSPPAGDPGAADPAWSPDGRELAYEAYDHLVRLDLSTGEIRAITHCRLPCITDYAPAWSPDGTRIAFIRDEEPGASTHLYLLDLSTGRIQRVGPLADQQWGPSWRP